MPACAHRAPTAGNGFQRHADGPRAPHRSGRAMNDKHEMETNEAENLIAEAIGAAEYLDDPFAPAIVHRILAPHGVNGRLLEIVSASDVTVDSVVARVGSEQGAIHELKLFHRWPVRTPRPYLRRDEAVAPLLTGQRILDTFFPLVKGGRDPGAGGHR